MDTFRTRIGRVKPKGNLTIIAGGAQNRQPAVKTLYEFAEWLQTEASIKEDIEGVYALAWDSGRHAAGWAFIGKQGVSSTDLPDFAREYASQLMASGNLK